MESLANGNFTRWRLQEMGSLRDVELKFGKFIILGVYEMRGSVEWEFRRYGDEEMKSSRDEEIRIW